MIPLVFASRETLYSSISALHFRTLMSLAQKNNCAPRSGSLEIDQRSSKLKSVLGATSRVVSSIGRYVHTRTKMVAILRRITLVFQLETLHARSTETLLVLKTQARLFFHLGNNTKANHYTTMS